jgi:P-type E1-E2 ATPase
VVVLDKTGTLSQGELTVTEADDETLRVAAGLERHSAHPIARAIVEAARVREIALPKATLAHETAGKGVTGVVDGILRRVGPGPREAGLQVVEVEGLGRIVLGDRLREDAAQAMAACRALGLEVVLLTGDRRGIADVYAEHAGIGRVVAEATPIDKLAEIERLQRTGRTVLYVGDGLNDVPAIQKADVGIAMGSGAGVAILSAKGVMLGDRLEPLVDGVRTARLTQRVIRRTVARSVAYNATAVVLALAGLVNPLVAAVLMPLSSGSVLLATRRIGGRST